jgi:hypothetical protein
MLSSMALILALVVAPKPVSFKADIAPILASKCLGCHNDRKAAGGLNMTTFALLKKGGKSAGGQTIVAGDPDASHLIEVILRDASPRMPLKQPPLADPQIATLSRWVKEGASFDGGSEQTTSLASLVDPLRDLPRIVARTPTSDPVTSVGFSADGTTLAAAVGKSVIVFDVRSGSPIATHGDHPGPVSSVAIAPDGKTVVAAGGRAGQFGFVTIWDLPSKTRRHDLRGHTDAILSAALSPDGKTLATASYDRMIILWDVNLGRQIRTLKEHTDAVHAVTFSRDGTRIASGGADRTVKVWEIATGRRFVSLSDSTGEVYAVAFGATGTQLFAGGVDRSIRAWELSAKGGTPTRSVFAHDGAILRLAVTSDGARILSTGEDRAVKSWETSTFKPIAHLGIQPDWPQALAISPNMKRIAVGRYDGSLALLDASTGKNLLSLRDVPKPAPAAPKPKPQLVRNASLNPPSPRGGLRGTKVRVALSGNGVGEAVGVHFDDSGLVATIVRPEKPQPDQIDFDLEIPKTAAPGPRRFTVQTPLGVPASKVFVVSEFTEVPEAEPNDQPTSPGKLIAMPATLVGTIDRPGDLDRWSFTAGAGQKWVFAVEANRIGSTLDTVMKVVDESGQIVAKASASPTRPDPVLIAVAPKDGVLTLEVSDAQFGGDGAHFYRINAGRYPYATSAFPLGVRRGGKVNLALQGANVASHVEVAATTQAGGSLLPVPYAPGRSIVVAEGVQTIESADKPSIETPGGVSGRIDRDGDSDIYKFAAKKGQRVVVEIFGRRLGSPIDPAIEILDASGKAVPRAVLRPVEETNVAFRDHPSTTRAIRLTKWDELAMGDYLLVGRELVRLAALPRNPDDDAVFWGLGNERSDSGERVAFLETTPEHHPLGQPMFKVEIHPPGARFPEGGLAPITLNYRNDDGGPGFGKDSRLTFDPPSDGTYQIRVEDVRGLGSPDHGYHLVVRPSRPDFSVSLSTSDPNIPRGGATVVRVDLARVDGFDGAVDVTVEGLPPGISSTPARIEAGAFTADLLLSADDSVPAVSPPTWRVVARSVPESSGDEVVCHDLDPGGATGGRITVTPRPDLTLAARPPQVVIRPGERVEITLAVTRGPAFAGRVPIDVRNLPFGVRVLNIGLNGVLVTESQTERSVFLYAEPWVKPMERPIFAVGKIEATGTSSAAPAIPLVIQPTRARPLDDR